jgi:endoglucanase
LVETMRRLRSPTCSIYAVGTIQEEVGLRGATTAAFQIHPDVGLALEATVAGDIPGVKENEAPAKIRGGPTLTVADAGLIAHPKVLQLCIESAEAQKIPYQVETGIRGATDASRIALSREGVPCGVLAVPSRYIHSPASIANLKDAENTIKLAIAVIKNVPKYF